MSAPCEIDEKSAIMHMLRANLKQKKIEKAFISTKTYYIKYNNLVQKKTRIQRFRPEILQQ